MSLKTLLRYPIDFPRAVRLVGDSAPPHANAAPVVLRLSGESMLIDLGRHLASIAISAAKNNRPLSLVCPRIVLAAIGRKAYGRQFLTMPHVTWTDARDPRTLDSHALHASRGLELTDTPACPQSQACSDLAVELRIGREIEPGMPVMPYPMHPTVALQTNNDLLEQLRKESRSRRVFFAGNQKPSYGDSKLQREFGVMSRLEVVAKISETFSRDLESGKIVLSDSRKSPISIDDWLPAIAKSDFFLCPPGSSQPLCHNFAEAISVGTIPILEYGERVRPHLVDGENAIFFQGPHGLITAVARVMAMTQTQINTLRAGVIQFYEMNYRHEVFLQRMMESTEANSASAVRKVCMPFHHQNLFRDSDRVIDPDFGRRAA